MVAWRQRASGFLPLLCSILGYDCCQAFLLDDPIVSIRQKILYRGTDQSIVRKSSLKNTRLWLSSPRVSSQDSVIDLIPLQRIHENPDVEILSRDPLVYVIHNLLTEQECQEYQDYVLRLDQEASAKNGDDTADSNQLHPRAMVVSNPPQVDLDVRKLWPLTLFSLAAGLPPLLFHNDLSGALLNIFIATIGSLVLAYQVVLPLMRQRAMTSARTSRALALNQVEDAPLIDKLMQRIQNFTQHSHWEAPVATCYDPGAVFARHNDASLNPSEWEGLGGQRVVTVICYLNTVQSGGGGETYFDQLDIKVKPTMGKALVFFPSQQLVADDRTTHESLPCTKGQKWIVQVFGRANPVPPPLGLPIQ